MRNILTLLIFLCFGLHSFAQPTSQTWETETIKSLRSGEGKSFACIFRVYDDRVDWVQGSFVQSLDITSTEGDLPARGNGQVVYNLIKEGKRGKLIIERQEDKVVLTLDLADGGKEGAFFSFEILNP